LRLKIDLHVHSHYSADSVITPEDIIRYAKKRGLDGVAITDHDRIDGALRIAEKIDLLVIPGIEVSSRDGHIVGLCVNEVIPPKLSAGETVEKIHATGGIAIACHPISLFKGGLGRHLTSGFDAVETINSSAFPFGYSVKNAERIASHLGVARVAGSDAHYGPEIGYAHTLVDAESTVGDVVEAIRNRLCQPFGKAIPLTLRVKRKFLTSIRK
jgi:predicted metal-dependent phosphoesterase TrpH